MILFKCDRCGKLMKTPLDNFTVTITPPEFRKFGYYEGDMHFCADCMDKLQLCIEELGRSKDE